ncbi:hypothetical protein [Methylobacterium sp. JK268]
MPIPDDMALVKGDVILVRAVVRHAGMDGRSAQIFATTDAFTDLFVTRESAELAETALAVGDEVIVRQLPRHGCGFVRAIDGDDAWVRWGPAGDDLDPVQPVADLIRTRTAAQAEANAPRPGETAEPAEAGALAAE